MHSEYSPYRWYGSGTLAPVNCWRGCGDTEIARASENDTLDGEEVGTREGNSTYTMNFIGHGVRVELADRGCA